MYIVCCTVAHVPMNKKPPKKSQTINLGDTASPHIGSGDPGERAQKARTTIGRQA